MLHRLYLLQPMRLSAKRSGTVLVKGGSLMFYTPAMLAGWLKSCIVSSRIGSVYPECSGGIVLLNGHKRVLPPECLYIGDLVTVSDAITRKLMPDKPYIFLCAGSSPDLDVLPCSEQITLIQTNLDLLGLYNKVQFHVHKFLDWDRTLQQAVLSNEGFQKILDCAYAGMKTTLVMLNAGYKVLAACYEPGLRDPLTTELQENGYLSFESVKEITSHTSEHRAGSDELGYIEYLSAQSGRRTIMWPIEYENTVVGRLVVVMNDSGPAPNYLDLCRILIFYLRQYMLSGRSASYGGNAAFGSLVADLIELKLSDQEELKERLKQVPLVIKSYYHLLVVSFPNETEPAFPQQSAEPFSPVAAPPNIPWNYVVSQLQQIFPFSNITIYHNEILILVRKTSRSSRFEFDVDAVTHILSYYNGYMAVGNYSKFLTSLAPIYHQTRSAVRLGLTLGGNPKQRVFYYEDYAIYQEIELAAMGLKNIYGITNYVYLCHPALIRLLRYDRKHDNNLCRVLYVYLTTDRNAAEAARELYLHRNTMLYKISKIEEILGQSLDDCMFRSRLLYSYYVLEYVTRYLKIDILNLYKGQKPKLSWLEPENNLSVQEEPFYPENP